MKEFLISNWPTILIIAAFLVWIVNLAVKGKWAELRGIAYRLMLQAESAIRGTKRGQERFETVFTQVYSLIPAWLRFWFPEDLVREKLQDWFNTIKDYLDNGKIDKSVEAIKPPDIVK